MDYTGEKNKEASTKRGDLAYLELVVLILGFDSNEPLQEVTDHEIEVRAYTSLLASKYLLLL